uniref:Uncharacterized protein n=1 Tax=Philodina roseola TaxID=96448 RepID=B5AHD2_PHIRO|nr:hypothetical protein 21 [Philodina roseola]
MSSTSKKAMRELNSITNHLLLTKTLNALTNNNSSSSSSSNISIKENIPTDSRLNVGASILKPTERDNVAALLQIYQQQLNNNNLLSNASLSVENFLPKKSMTFLCRFQQRNRLIEVPTTSEFYNSTSGISHEHLKQLIEFQLQKTSVIIQIWNEQYNEYIDVESFKKIPFDGRLQVLIFNNRWKMIDDDTSRREREKEKQLQMNLTSSSEKSHLSTNNSPISTSTPTDHQNDDEPSTSKSIHFEENLSTFSIENSLQTPIYDLLAKPSDGIPIPRFPPHIIAFLNGTGDANQLNALVQALYQEIVKYELYPNADELRSIVSRLVERHPNCLNVIGSVELLVRKLYYKFCNERKKYPVELKRRQPNKRKRFVRDDELNSSGKNNHPHVPANDLDRLMNLWTQNPTNTTTDMRVEQQQRNDGETSPTHSNEASSNSPSSSSPDLHQRVIKLEKTCPLNLSMSINNFLPSQ